MSAHLWLRLMKVLVIMTLPAHVACAQNVASRNTDAPAPLSKVVSARVLRLAEWPKQAMLPETKVDLPPRQGAKGTAEVRVGLQWIKRVLAPSVAPPQGTDAFFVPDNDGKSGVFRMRWEFGGYSIAVSNAANLCVIKFNPIGGEEGTGADSAAKLTVARDLCSRMFNNIGTRWGSQPGVPVEVSNLATKIADSSFDVSTTQLLENGILYGRPKSKAEAGDSSSSDHPDWFSTSEAWRYWFRNVYWWNDGHSVVMFFPTIDGGAAADVAR